MSSSGVDSLGSGRRLVVSEICFSTIFCVSPHPGSQSMSSVPTLAVGWPLEGKALTQGGACVASYTSHSSHLGHLQSLVCGLVPYCPVGDSCAIGVAWLTGSLPQAAPRFTLSMRSCPASRLVMLF